MDDTVRKSSQYTGSSLPFILISGIFFSVYLCLAAIIIGYLYRGFNVISLYGSPQENLNSLNYFTGVWISIFLIIIMVIPFAGSLFLMRELKKQSLPRKPLLPLAVILGVIGISSCMLIVGVYFPRPFSLPVQFIGFYVLVIAFFLLPSGAAYFIRKYQDIDSYAPEFMSKPVKYIAIVAFCFFIYFIISMLYYAVTSTFPLNDILLSLGPAWGIIIIVYVAIALPFIGVQVLRIGMRYRNPHL